MFLARIPWALYKAPTFLGLLCWISSGALLEEVGESVGKDDPVELVGGRISGEG